MRQLTLDLRPDYAPRFDNFVTGEQNGEMRDTLRLQARFGQPPQIYLWGAAGSGRSHLLAAAEAEASAGGRVAARAEAITGEGDFPLPENGLLCIDDVDQLNAAGVAALFRAFIRASQRGTALLLSGSAPPAALSMREDVRTRIGQCLVFEIHPLDDAHKHVMLALYAQSLGLPLDGELIDYLLRHGTRDMAWLRRIVDALNEASFARHRAATLPLLREVMQTCAPTPINLS